MSLSINIKELINKKYLNFNTRLHLCILYILGGMGEREGERVSVTGILWGFFFFFEELILFCFSEEGDMERMAVFNVLLIRINV